MTPSIEKVAEIAKLEVNGAEYPDFRVMVLDKKYLIDWNSIPIKRGAKFIYVFTFVFGTKFDRHGPDGRTKEAEVFQLGRKVALGQAPMPKWLKPITTE